MERLLPLQGIWVNTMVYTTTLCRGADGVMAIAEGEVQ